jgi:peptide deformylase
MDEITIYPATVLRRRAMEVEKVDGSIRSLIDLMTDLMYQGDGVGLAAPQAGVSKRVIVLDVGEGPMCLVNPELVETDREKETAEEGCLSLPGIRIGVHRPRAITVRGLNEKGETIVKTVDGLWARAFQHEIDHLNGVLIIDHTTMVQKTLLKSRLKLFHKRGNQS